MKKKIAKDNIKKLLFIANNTVDTIIQLATNTDKERILREYFLKNVDILRRPNYDQRDTAIKRKGRTGVPGKIPKRKRQGKS